MSEGRIKQDDLSQSLQDKVNEIDILSGSSVQEKANKSDLDAHSNDNVKHITSTERDTWNGKVDSSAYSDYQLGLIYGVRW